MYIDNFVFLSSRASIHVSKDLPREISFTSLSLGYASSNYSSTDRISRGIPSLRHRATNLSRRKLYELNGVYKVMTRTFWFMVFNNLINLYLPGRRQIENFYLQFNVIFLSTSNLSDCIPSEIQSLFSQSNVDVNA